MQNEIIYNVYVSSFYYTNQFLNNVALSWENLSQTHGIKAYTGKISYNNKALWLCNKLATSPAHKFG